MQKMNEWKKKLNKTNEKFHNDAHHTNIEIETHY